MQLVADISRRRATSAIGTVLSMLDSDVRISVENPSFALDRLAADCGPLQYLREFTQNGLEALEGRSGRIEWCEDVWSSPSRALSGRKLCIFDTGTGMTHAELDRLVGQLFSSGRVQGLQANFGVGAKIASLPHNPLGVVYTTLKDGSVSQLHLCRSEEGAWVRRMPIRDSRTRESLEQLPPAVQKAQHGTMVTLLGASADEDTTAQPQGTGGAATTWLIKWLNSRYFSIPKTVEIKVARFEGKDKAGRLVDGQHSRLDSASDVNGSVLLPEIDVVAHWWILNESRTQAQSSYAALHGHVGVVYSSEVYDASRPGSSSYAHLRNCGVTFGCKQIVIYFELTGNLLERACPDTARNRLLLDGTPLPLEVFEEVFAKSLPSELVAHVERSAPKAEDPAQSAAMRKQLAETLQRLGLSRYRSSEEGAGVAGSGSVPGGDPHSGASTSGTGTGSPGGPGGRAGEGYLPPGDERSGTLVAGVTLPMVHWVSTKDGTRPADEMEDRAAQYVEQGNKVLVNADFRGFVGLESYWRSRLKGAIGAPEAIRRALRQEVELALLEAVASMMYMKRDRGTWSANDRELALSQEALTTLAMQRYRFDQAIARAVRGMGTPTDANG